MEIRDFWKEQWEDRKQRKQQKKDKKKFLTKEDKAYRWGYVGFLIFFVVFFAIRNCMGSTSNIGESTDDISFYGYTSEVVEILNRGVSEEDVLKGLRLSKFDSWNAFEAKCTNAGLNIFKDNDFDHEQIFGEENMQFTNFELNSLELAGLIFRLIESGTKNGMIELYEFSLTCIDDVVQMESLVYLNMSSLRRKDSIPNMFVRSVSNVECICDEWVCTNTQMFINDLNEDDNELVINTISSSFFGGFEDYTNNYLVNEISFFAAMIDSEILFADDCVKFTKIGLSD